MFTVQWFQPFLTLEIFIIQRQGKRKQRAQFKSENTGLSCQSRSAKAENAFYRTLVQVHSYVQNTDLKINHGSRISTPLLYREGSRSPYSSRESQRAEQACKGPAGIAGRCADGISLQGSLQQVPGPLIAAQQCDL